MLALDFPDRAPRACTPCPQKLPQWLDLASLRIWEAMFIYLIYLILFLFNFIYFLFISLYVFLE